MMAVLGHGHSHGGDSLEDGGHHHGNEKGHHHNRQSGCHSDNVQMNFQTWRADEDPDDKPPPVGMGRRFENINVRAAFIHVIGDLIQSVGVVIAGYIIKFWVRTCGCAIVKCCTLTCFLFPIPLLPIHVLVVS